MKQIGALGAFVALALVSSATLAQESFPAGIEVGTDTRAFVLLPRVSPDTFSVPYLRPTTANSTIAFDIIPNGTPTPVGARNMIAWIDVTNKDVEEASPSTNAARLGIGTDHVEIGGYRSPGETALPVYLIQGNNERIILDADPAVKVVGVYGGAQRSFVVVSSSGTEQMYVRGDGLVGAPSIYAATTANASNLNIDNAGIIRRSTSAAKYKTNVQPITPERLALFKQLKGVTYTSLSPGDDPNQLRSGVIADQAEALGLTDLVLYGPDGEVEGFAYERCAAYFLAWMQEMEAGLAN